VVMVVEVVVDGGSTKDQRGVAVPVVVVFVTGGGEDLDEPWEELLLECEVEDEEEDDLEDDDATVE
jgi:hypothetical protein